MATEFTFPAAFNGLSGLVLLALGLVILRIKPRRMPNLILATFLITFGLRFALINLAGILGPEAKDWNAVIVGVGAAGAVVASVAMVLLALSYPRGLRPKERWPILAVPVALSTIAILVLLAVLATDSASVNRAYVDFGPLPHAVRAVDLASLLVAIIVQVLLVDIIARRYPTMERDERRPAVLLAAALTLYPSFTMGAAFAIEIPGLRIVSRVGALLLIVSAGLWLYATARVEPEGRPAARNMAMLGLGVYLVGVLVSIAIGLDTINDSILPGSFRLLGAAALAYAILRHQLLGLDIRVRWTISHSTVAGAFIAAFFVASEAAQEFFQASSNSAYWGIAAAGALVFAFSPLQRLADSIARRAVPDGRGGPVPARPGAAPDNESIYREAVRHALGDRTVSAAESLYLADLGERLGLSARRALELRSIVEMQARGEPRTAARKRATGLVPGH